MRIKIRSDGTRLIIPSTQNRRCFKFGFKATMHNIRGNCFDARWEQDTPELGLTKGDVVYNVPPTMFVRDTSFLHLSDFVRKK